MTATNTQPKIFGIGLNKTGTTTLAECGKILGYRCTGCHRHLLKDVILRNDFTNIKQTISRFDLFQDWPWPLIYQKLDQMYPGSQFILTVRKSEQVWLESLKQHSLRTPPLKHCRKLAYGYNYPHRRQKEHLDFYRKHNDSVREYFKHRSGDFIELCWENGDGFEQLCNFLGCEPPDRLVPHANKGVDNFVKKGRVLMNQLLISLNY